MDLGTALTAEVLGVTPKTLDNLITRLPNSIVKKGVNGRSRAIPLETVERLAIALLLRRDLELPIRRALQLADQLRAQPEGALPIGVLASISFDLPRLRSVLQMALANAMEVHAFPRRGRPPRTRN